MLLELEKKSDTHVPPLPATMPRGRIVFREQAELKLMSCVRSI